jgi:hypothetical protein
LNEKDTERYWKLNIQDEMLFVSKSLLPESFLITLISKYEYFFTNLLRVIYNEFPTKLENEIKVSLESL